MGINKSRKKRLIILKKQIVLCLIITICIVNINFSTSLSGFISEVQSEGTNLPTPAPEPTPTPDPTPTPTPEPDPEPEPEPDPEPEPEPEPSEKQTDFYETIQYYGYIEGNAYEEIGNEIGKNGEDSKQAYKNIKNIKVQLLNGDKVVAETRTDDNGYYKIGVGAGSYTVRFVYGDVENADFNDVNEIKNILQYNGQDYMAVDLSDTVDSSNINVEEEEVKLNGKSAIQMFLLLDCSYSARTTKVTLDNGTVKTRLELETEATFQLIESLLNSDENVYIGLIFFTGDCYRSVALTRNESKLKESLNEIKNNSWNVPNTDIACALDKAKDSFYNNDKDNSNRVIALISDCIPTKYGDTKVYNNESEEETINKLYNTIGPGTRKKVEELKNDGIKIMTLGIETNDDDANKFVSSIFQGTSDLFVKSKDGYELVQAITKLLKKQLLEIETEEKKYISEDVWESIRVDDEGRREEVKKNFEKLFYQNTSLFKVIDEYNASESSKQQAKTLSEKTKMYALKGEYVLEGDPIGRTTERQEVDKDGDTITYHTTYEPIGYKLNLGLCARPAADINLKTTITGLKFTLANGQILERDTREMNSEVPIVKYVDQEIVQGSTVELEYQIQISNNSSTQYSYMALINYLPYGFNYVPNNELITEERTNESYWGSSTVSMDDFYTAGLISQNTYNKYSNREAVISISDNGNQGKNGFYLAPGGKMNLKIVCSKLISNLGDIDDLEKDKNVTEVLAYSNISSRRMIKYKSNNTNAYAIYPGDAQDTDCSADTTNKASIIPPTGGISKNMNLLIAIVSLSSMIMILAVILLKKRK